MPRTFTRSDIERLQQKHAAVRAVRAMHARECEGCGYFYPNRVPSRLLPGAKCAVCGHTDRRPRLTDAQVAEAVRAAKAEA